MKTAVIIGIIVAVAIVIGVVSSVAYMPSDSEPELLSDTKNDTGKFIKIELDEAISAKAKP